MTDKEDAMTIPETEAESSLTNAKELLDTEKTDDTSEAPEGEVADSASLISGELEVLGDDDDEESPKLLEEELVPAESFEELALAPSIMDAIKNLGWSKPTTIQGLCLPLTTQGQDLAGFSQTGTGKTGVFLITIAHQIVKLRETVGENSTHPKAMILAPTRELAVQISQDAETLFNQLNISCLAVYGGVDYDKQAQRIRAGVDVLVATPGRLKDYYQKKIFSTQDCCLFICDEADRMLDMGFIEDVEYFLSKLSPETQKLLFSATTNEQVKELAFEYLENPKYISANPEVITPERIEQHAVICDSTQKLQVMLGLLKEHSPTCSIIFVNTKIVAEWLHYKLVNNGIEVDLITGDLPQKKRIALIHRIKAGEVKALIATDVASRGLHISGITHVYNFDLPDEAANYVHRIGRTARAGAFGSAYSLVCEDYGHNLLGIQKYLGENVLIKMMWFPETFLSIEDKSGNPYKDENFKGYSKKDDSDRSGRRRQGGRQGEEQRPKLQKSDGPRLEARKPGTPPPEKKKGAGKEKDSTKPDQKIKGRPQAAQTGKAQAANEKNHGRNRHRKPSIHGPKDGQPTRVIMPKKKEVVPTTLGGLFKKILAVLFPWLKKK
jgi:ATP-dependent RNA helicase RhlB